MSTTQQSLGRGRGVIRADQVPDFIRQAAAVISDDQAAEAASKRTASAKPATIPSSMPFSQARKVVAGLKHIGKGVYEDNLGQVWWREGNLLKRRATDRDRLVGDYLADCKARESRKAMRTAAVDGKTIPPTDMYKTLTQGKNAPYKCVKCGGPCAMDGKVEIPFCKRCNKYSMDYKKTAAGKPPFCLKCKCVGDKCVCKREAVGRVNPSKTYLQTGLLARVLTRKKAREDAAKGVFDPPRNGTLADVNYGRMATEYISAFDSAGGKREFEDNRK